MPKEIVSKVTDKHAGVNCRCFFIPSLLTATKCRLAVSSVGGCNAVELGRNMSDFKANGKVLFPELSD